MSLLDVVSSRRVPSLAETSELFDDALSHRTELAAIELDEARGHAQTSVLLLALAGFLAILGGVTLALLLAGLVWDSPHRAWWLAGMCAAYLGGAVLSGLAVRRRLEAWRPLAETRNQLQHDYKCLTRLVKAIIP